MEDVEAPAEPVDREDHAVGDHHRDHVHVAQPAVQPVTPAAQHLLRAHHDARAGQHGVDPPGHREVGKAVEHVGLPAG